MLPLLIQVMTIGELAICEPKPLHIKIRLRTLLGERGTHMAIQPNFVAPEEERTSIGKESEKRIECLKTQRSLQVVSEPLTVADIHIV